MNRVFMILLLLLVPVLLFSQNTNISGGIVFEGEPYMTVNPSNPQHIVVAWMGYVPFSRVAIKVKSTLNGGSTWSTTSVISHQSGTYTSADVSMAFDRLGNLYLCYIDYRQSPDSGGVYVVRSTDGGLSWGTSHQVIDVLDDGSKRPIDRPWLVIGQGSGSMPDTLFVTTKPAPWIAPPNRPYFMRSWDYGSTWTTWKNIDSTGYQVGNSIQAPMASAAVDSAGKFHCVYPTYYLPENAHPRFILANYLAGRFSYHEVYSITGSVLVDTLAKTGMRLICDPTNNKHFAFFTLLSSGSDLDVFWLETYDAGSTWSAPSRVNDDAVGAGKMQDLAWCNFDERGNIVAAWRDRRNASGAGYDQPSEIWGAIKWKDSTRFSTNFMISDALVPYDSVYLAGNGNDFMNVVLAQDTLTAVWGDVRTGALNIWYSRRKVSTGVTSAIRNLVNEQMPIVSIFPNPAQGVITVKGTDLLSVSIINGAGTTVYDKKINSRFEQLKVTHLPTGDYVIFINTLQGVVSKRVILE